MSRIILITNDDGIQANGILRLARAAKKYGEVWVVAPDGQRSAASHSITLNHAIDVYPYDFPVEGVKAFAITGTPADCVRVGVRGILPVRPDIVFSGINFGINTATDLQYSATAGAAFEAVFQGIPAIAFSERQEEGGPITDAYLDQIIDELIGQRLGYGEIWNVNFPGGKVENAKGILRNRTVSKYSLFDDHYVGTPLPDGGTRYKVNGIISDQAEEGSDLRAIQDGYISIGIVKNLC